MQTAGVVFSKLPPWSIISGRFTLYFIVNFPPYTGSLLYNVLFRIVNIRILSYLVRILRILLFLEGGGVINNLFYSVRKQRDLLSETEG